MRARIYVLVLLSLALFACAEEPVTTLRADPADVARSGVVLPVDGITSSGQPDEAALGVYANSGYVAVIDLRAEDESRGIDEQAVVEGLGMQYLSMPISGAPDVTFENAEKLATLIDAYDGPVLVHCKSGNRVGALLALAKIKDGLDERAALEYGREAGMTGLEKRVREVLEEQ